MPRGSSHARKFLKMLFGKDFGGRHQGYLCTGANSLQRRQCRDDGLARANIALNKPEHRQWLAQVLTDVGQHMALGTGECKGQGIQETLGQIPRGQERERFTSLNLFTHLKQAQLMGQQFFHHQALLRRMASFHKQVNRRAGWRGMHQLDSFGDSGQLILGQQVPGQPVTDREPVKIAQSLLAERADARLLDALCQRVNRGQGRITFRWHGRRIDLVLRVVELITCAPGPDFAEAANPWRPRSTGFSGPR